MFTFKEWPHREFVVQEIRKKKKHSLCYRSFKFDAGSSFTFLLILLLIVNFNFSPSVFDNYRSESNLFVHLEDMNMCLRFIITVIRAPSGAAVTFSMQILTLLKLLKVFKWIK